MKVLNYGARKEFADLTGVDELYNRYRLTKNQIVSDILDVLEAGHEQ